jgi:multisubunit Na+/H+ antiporter MnhE subunit
VLFAYSGDHFSWIYIFAGMVSSFLASFIAFKTKIINKHSHFLFLHIGFYKHFLSLLFSSFLSSVLLILRSAISSRKINPEIHFLSVKKLTNSQLVLLIPTLNLMKGILFISFKDNKIELISFEEKYFKQIDLDKIIENLDKVNDNRLV